MAIARLEMKVGKVGKAASHAAYISRIGKYENRLSNAERLLATEVGNLPIWAKANPLEFWRASDAFERANGTAYREMEIALPRELNDRQQVELVQQWVKQEIGNKHAYQWAIHIPKAADGGDQPHVHLMFSERQVDGIERDPNQYFKRYNSKAPEKGGSRKGYGDHAGQTLSKSERIEDLKKLRLRWQKTANNYLRFCTDSKARIDMCSYAERGLDTIAEPKQLPSAWRGEGKQQILELRAAKAEIKKEFPYIDKIKERLDSFMDIVKKAEKEYQNSGGGLYGEMMLEKLEKAKIQLALAQEEIIAGKLPVIGSMNEEVERRWQQISPLETFIEQNKQPIIAAEPTKKEEDVFLISIYYERNQPGNSNDRGVTIEREFVDADNLKKYSNYYEITEPSSTDPRITPYIWFNSTSSNESYSLHIHEINGTEPEAEDYQKIANLIGVRFDYPIEFDNSEQKIKSPEDDSLIFDGF